MSRISSDSNANVPGSSDADERGWASTSIDVVAVPCFASPGATEVLPESVSAPHPTRRMPASAADRVPANRPIMFLKYTSSGLSAHPDDDVREFAAGAERQGRPVHGLVSRRFNHDPVLARGEIGNGEFSALLDPREILLAELLAQVGL